MNLKEIRTRRGLSQSEVAARLGYSANVYARYERGERQPSIETLIHLSEIFGVSVDFIIGNHAIEAASLSKYEIELVRASRAADERAKEDALILFRSHKVL